MIAYLLHHPILFSALLLVLLGVVAAWSRAWRAVDVAIGHDPYGAAWRHRRYVENQVAATRANYRRMS